MGEVFIELFNRVGMIIILSMIVSKVSVFRKWVTKENLSISDKIIAGAFFGLIGIWGTYAGIPIDSAIANARVIGPAVGGLIGGPFVGILAGLIAGIHRLIINIDGFTTIPCVIATISEGVLAGVLSRRFEASNEKWLFGFYLGAAVESMHMIFVLALARPFVAAIEVVKIIAGPMILANAVGISIFVLMIDSIHKDQLNLAANQAHKALNIANETIAYLRKGLNEESVEKTIEIIYKMTGFKAVSMSNTERCLGHIGAGSDHHCSGKVITTSLTKRVIQSGHLIVANQADEIECDHRRCPLKSAVVVPLFENGNVVGSLKLYKSATNAITKLDKELANGLASLFSTQLDLSRLDQQEEQLTRSQLIALQSQINPHFLFNALNTISSLVRINPNEARELLIHLSDHFRNTLMDLQTDIAFDEEINHVKSYVAIEKARFRDKIDVEYDLAEALECYIPPLLIQPLVENAIKHGLLEKDGGGSVKIIAKQCLEGTAVTVKDNGRGIEETKLKSVLDNEFKSQSIGLKNVNNRLVNKFGDSYGLKIESELGIGTTVQFMIPRV